MKGNVALQQETLHGAEVLDSSGQKLWQSTLGMAEQRGKKLAIIITCQGWKVEELQEEEANFEVFLTH